MKELIYFDNAATTPIRPEVYEEIKPYIEEHFGNPSSIYSIARDSKKAIDKARQQVADALNAQPAEIYFTGCGSESDNWVLKGVSSALKNKGNHIITTCIEHHAILHTCEYLEKNGFEVTYLPVDDMVGVSLKTNYQIPTSEKRNVENTPFDFRTPAPCRQALSIDGGGKPGLDHCFCLSGEGMRVAGSLVDVDSGRKVEVLTTMPGMQVYMANWVDGEFPHLQHNGVALECQHYPDSPNHPEFPTTVLYPNQTYDERIMFRFLYVCFVFSYKQVNTTISS